MRHAIVLSASQWQCNYIARKNACCALIVLLGAVQLTCTVALVCRPSLRACCCSSRITAQIQCYNISLVQYFARLYRLPVYTTIRPVVCAVCTLDKIRDNTTPESFQPAVVQTGTGSRCRVWRHDLARWRRDLAGCRPVRATCCRENWTTVRWCRGQVSMTGISTWSSRCLPRSTTRRRRQRGREERAAVEAARRRSGGVLTMDAAAAMPRRRTAPTTWGRPMFVVGQVHRSAVRPSYHRQLKVRHLHCHPRRHRVFSLLRPVKALYPCALQPTAVRLKHNFK